MFSPIVAHACHALQTDGATNTPGKVLTRLSHCLLLGVSPAADVQV